MTNSIRIFFENFNVIIFIVENILWLIGTVVFIFMVRLIKVPYILRKILKNNRETLGNGYGKHLADIFIESWYLQIDVNVKKRYNIFSLGGNHRLFVDKKNDVFGKELELLKLIKIKDNRICAIKNARNRIIFFVTKWFLICIIGDSKKYYNNLK